MHLMNMLLLLLRCHIDCPFQQERKIIYLPRKIQFLHLSKLSAKERQKLFSADNKSLWIGMLQNC